MILPFILFVSLVASRENALAAGKDRNRLGQATRWPQLFSSLVENVVHENFCQIRIYQCSSVVENFRFGSAT